ncbi:fluoride export protein 2-like isoform X2 [Vigna unguiculata]|uniref:fluoride export protein 2-like isoform X2 n=1 Tax=Vigna unguiculata TaxID=3917 RepID=UPI0010163E35|nr:fluoride export protein 2-like isoform X2 [Vigna unguiculata]
MERLSCTGSSIRRRSTSISSHISHHTDNDDECERVSEAGDIGDRALPSTRHSESGSTHFSFDIRPEENEVVVSTEEEEILHPNSTLSTGAIVDSEAINHVSSIQHFHIGKLVEVCRNCWTMLHVLTRYLLQKLFGPGVGNVTSNQTLLYLDLPSNMIGSFLMGWFGVVFKGDISNVSEHLAIAITTGYLGSLTTFSGWNQKMLELSVSGHWLFASLGFVVGLFLVAFSIIFGIETAKGFRWLLSKLSCGAGSDGSIISTRVDSNSRQLTILMMFLVILIMLWGVCGVLVKAEFRYGGSAAELWFACMVGPIGVWIRWFLARLNGRGLGKAGLLKWIPYGTLIANVSAAFVMAALATLKKAVHTRDYDTIVSGTQFGLLGCLSTVSTFAVEFNAMRESNYPWRAYAYAIITICISFVIGILVYCVPVWTKGV